MNFETLKRPVQFVNSHKKPIMLTTGIILFIIAIVSVSYVAYAQACEGRVYHNVFVGTVNVGGLTKVDATQIINQHIDSLLDQGLDMSVDGKVSHLDLRKTSIESTDVSHDLIYFDPADLADVAMGIGRGDSFFKNLITPVMLVIRPEILQALPEIDEEYIQEQIKLAFGDLETEAIPADYKIEIVGDDVSVSFEPGTDGEELNLNSAIESLWEDAHDLDLRQLNINLQIVTYDMTEQDALSLSDEIILAIQSAPYTLTYTAETLLEYQWDIEADDLLNWMEPFYRVDDDHNNIPAIRFAGDAYDVFLEEVASDINIDPINARFAMEDGVVTEFRGSQNGIEFDDEVTINELLDLLGQEDVSLEITVASTPPDISIEDVNSFGITEILGVGTSNFSGSPSNRMINIAHGSEKLNGLLIAPGQKVSLIEHLRPFTLEDGYLPEMVILGDEIKPEIGGGLCQIGTTAFRAIMNSGLQVDERRNHSLVVSYYNDPSNGNPGTDATLYDPHPDIQFTNTFDSYILLTTHVDIPSRTMEFTFWGTSDGRHGYYSPPKVLSWVPYGETEYKETLDLEPGTEKCQSAHSGATTQFTYYIDYADNTQYSEVFTSVYRPLQKICLVGVEELTVPCPEGEICEEVDEDSEDSTETTDELDVPIVE
ncbi:MAG: VanW family protein [Patescibacteria group bacterium]